MAKNKYKNHYFLIVSLIGGFIIVTGILLGYNTQKLSTKSKANEDRPASSNNLNTDNPDTYITVRKNLYGITLDLPMKWGNYDISKLLVAGVSYHQNHKSDWPIWVEEVKKYTTMPYENQAKPEKDTSKRFYFYQFTPLTLFVDVNQDGNYIDDDLDMAGWAVGQVKDPKEQIDQYVCIKTETVTASLKDFLTSYFKYFDHSTLISPGWVLCTDKYPEMEIIAKELLQSTSPPTP